MKPRWMKFYMELADALAPIPPAKLYESIHSLAAGRQALDYFHFDEASLWQERGHKIDPFTVMGIFNRGQTDAHRQELATLLASAFGVKEAPPACYHGIPHIDPRKSIYADAQALWALFQACLAGPTEKFASAWDTAIAVHGNGLATLSIGLFWVRPNFYMAVDRLAIPWIEQNLHIVPPGEKCSGNVYWDFLDQLKKAAQRIQLTYPEITYQAWLAAHPGHECL